jgi:soluble lytic murein transglycosylase-like protein
VETSSKPTVTIRQKVVYPVATSLESYSNLKWYAIGALVPFGMVFFICLMVFGIILISLFTSEKETQKADPYQNWEASAGFPQVAQKYLPIYQAAGKKYGVPWQILAAIHKVETDFGRDLSTSYVGAKGQMQVRP